MEENIYNEAECYDMEEMVFSHTHYKEKRYLFGLIRLRRPVTQVIARYKPTEDGTR
jgi:hypothetical protein